MTYYNITIPQLPTQFVQYCDNSNYSLSAKKKYIITHILMLTNNTDVDTIARNMRFEGFKVSISSIYQVLQWLTTHGFVIKTTNGHNQAVYRPNKQTIN
ncbi:transcriptional repressor [Mucilaginibacter aquaedulcis]|uniref:transcriptional repressor n=1 Tax=Mucilaginibacter aquaedulcis TaxID=1187081 RepID=UPI0025B534D6|nr:transcriptional repressor [Mucilaginibacter aquaedulcis]MDN3547056.1 transcriptional repressor [Mucilaginibacter aquaedulcis]